MRTHQRRLPAHAVLMVLAVVWPGPRISGSHSNAAAAAAAACVPAFVAAPHQCRGAVGSGGGTTAAASLAGGAVVPGRPRGNVGTRTAPAFSSPSSSPRHTTFISRSTGSRFTSATSSPTALAALGALAKQAKLAELRDRRQSGPPPDAHLARLLALVADAVAAPPPLPSGPTATATAANSPPLGPLQRALTRRRGTLTVIAEYRRKFSTTTAPTATTAPTTTPTSRSHDDGKKDNPISSFLEPEYLSPLFRDAGVSGIAVLADARMGGCTYADLTAFGTEQQRAAANSVPGPVAVINSDYIVDATQLAYTAALAVPVAAVVLAVSVVGVAALPGLLRAATAVHLEAIVAVANRAEAQLAVDAGARLLSVVVNPVDGREAPGGDGGSLVEAMVACIDNLRVPEGQPVCYIAHIPLLLSPAVPSRSGSGGGGSTDQKSLSEIEIAWAVRDRGFQCAWIGEALYATTASGGSGGSSSSLDGIRNTLQALRSKSSLKYGVPKALSTRGEGAREYLGDILM